MKDDEYLTYWGLKKGDAVTPDLVGPQRQPGPEDPDPWSWLTAHHQGRLDYETGRGCRSVAVLYAVADGQILFRLPDYNEIVHYAPGEQVTLEVDGARVVSDHPLTMNVTGTAALLESGQISVSCEDLFEESWPAEMSTRIIGLPLTTVQWVDPRV